MSDAAFYDALYQATPSKWNLPERDEIAYGLVTKYLPEADSILDIGCGNGHTLAYFHERTTAELFGIDLSAEAIRLAKQAVPSAQLYVGEFGKVDLPPVDLALVMGVAEHFLFLSDFFGDLSAVCNFAYIEAPNCMRYSDQPYKEGFRETYRGAGQIEWHLHRSSWERYISRHFDFVQRVQGTTDTTEFIWLLKAKDARVHYR